MKVKAQRTRVRSEPKCILDIAYDHFQLLEAITPLIIPGKQVSNYEKRVRYFFSSVSSKIRSLEFNLNKKYLLDEIH